MHVARPSSTDRISFANEGFTLVEVMVSIVLLATGLLGLAAQQSFSTRYDHQAHLRTQSVLLISDMIDRMRSNPAGVNGGLYTVDPIPETYTNCNLMDNNCTVQQLTDYDLVTWTTEIASILPAGTGAVAIEGIAANRNFTVSVTWQEPESERSLGEDYVNPCDGTSDSELRCAQLTVRL